MNSPTKELAALIEFIRVSFPTHPVPPYPELMGLDPLGKKDEYAGFADKPWPEIERVDTASTRFDINPAIGFSFARSPHMWNYYVPSFMTATLLHEGEFDVIDSFLFSFRDIEPHGTAGDSSLPWWHGRRHFENYSRAQVACVVRFLEFVRDYGEESPWEYEWEASDAVCLQRWMLRG